MEVKTLEEEICSPRIPSVGGTWLNKGRKAPQMGSTPGGIVKVGTSMRAGYSCNHIAKYGSKFLSTLSGGL